MKIIPEEDSPEANLAWKMFAVGIVACVVGIMLIPDAPLSGRIAGSGMVLVFGALVVAFIGVLRD